MPNTVNPNSMLDPETTSTGSSVPPATKPVPVKNYPGEHSEGVTVKNPKTPETSGPSNADRVADKAAHKAVKREQEYDKAKPIFTK
jgi:hypothetical protein